MLRVIRAGQVIDEDNLINLEELRHQLMTRLSLVLIGVSGLTMWLVPPLTYAQMVAFCLWSVLLVLGLGIRLLPYFHPILARHLLVWGLTGGLLAAMRLLPDPWLPFLGLLLPLIGAPLLPGSELATAGVIAIGAAWLGYSGARLYPLPELLPALAVSVVLTWLIVRSLYTPLQWAWTMQQRADQLLDKLRDRQAELSRILKSSELANILLRRTQHELVAARKRAEEARRMKEQFAANISHELRTPLNLILGFSEVMYLSPHVYGEMSWPPNLRRDIYQIYRSSRHLLEMIDDILDLSRFETVGFRLHKEPTALELLLTGTLEIAQDLFRGHLVHLETEIAPDLPSLEIDRTRIRQVVLNLLNNARRFTEVGQVRIAAKQENGEVVISVSDTGPGIPPDQLQSIFDEFYQVDLSLRRSYQGVGLGLAISKRFVQAHEGHIWVESEPGVGSTFFFSLPIPNHHLPSLPLPLKPLPEPQWPEVRPRLLVVDPDPGVATLIRRHLEAYEVFQVNQFEELAQAVTIHEPRLVICNIAPGEPPPHPPFVSTPVPLIECSLPSQAWLAKDLAVATCLTKPITSQQLLPQIGRLGHVSNILIIDDDPGFGQLVERMLETSGRVFKIRQAHDGEDGLLAMRTQQPDLVLLDLIMPGMDGFRVLEEMRQ
ncbi:MAG: hybrid sensor histidine kinase/response regulator, partial [Chloroflexi bacterium]|nr:hybrid sensor histidine kinase/response regulator [Chloroflexota bacterium]